MKNFINMCLQENGQKLFSEEFILTKIDNMSFILSNI